MAEIIEKKFEIAGAKTPLSVFPASLIDKAKLVLDVLDFPTTRNEAWKYTRVAKIKNASFKIDATHHLEANSVQKLCIPDLQGSVLVFVNGFYQAALSTIIPETGLEVSPLSEAVSKDWISSEAGSKTALEDQFFNAMNTRYASDGVAIRIAKKAQIEQTVQCLFISTGSSVYSGIRNVICAEDFSSAHIVLNFQSLEAKNCFSHSVTEIEAGINSQLTVDKIQVEADTNFCLAAENITQQKDSAFTINTVTLDGGLVRNDLTIAVAGQNSETNLSGAYILKGKQHVDNHTTVDHLVAHCNSNELYKGVIDQEATAVFNGKVFVRKDAQKINAFQSNGNVLLSDSAAINSKPELEIYADDVKCSHGSTTGQLDEEAIFYLRARGLSEKSARALMVNAFVGDVLDKIESEAVRAYLDKVLFEKFGWNL